MREGAGCADQGNAGGEPDDLQARSAGTQVLLQLGYQIGQSDIDEAAAGEGQKVRQKAGKVGHQPPADEPAQRSDRTGQGHLDQGDPPIAAVTGEDHEIANMVRYFMGHHREGGDHPQAQVRSERGRNEHAVTEAVDAVSRQQAPPASNMGVVPGMPVVHCMSAWLGVPVMIRMGVVPRVLMVDVLFASAVMVFMTVVPQLGFIQKEKEDQARQQHEEKDMRIGTLLEGLRQQVHEGRGQQGAGSQAQ